MKEKTENFTLKLNPIKSDPSKNRIYQKKKVEQKIIKDSIGIYPFKALNFIRREIRNTTAPNKNLPIKKAFQHLKITAKNKDMKELISSNIINGKINNYNDIILTKKILGKSLPKNSLKKNNLYKAYQENENKIQNLSSNDTKNILVNNNNVIIQKKELENYSNKNKSNGFIKSINSTSIFNPIIENAKVNDDYNLIQVNRKRIKKAMELDYLYLNKINRNNNFDIKLINNKINKFNNIQNKKNKKIKSNNSFNNSSKAAYNNFQSNLNNNLIYIDEKGLKSKNIKRGYNFQNIIVSNSITLNKAKRSMSSSITIPRNQLKQMNSQIIMNGFGLYIENDLMRSANNTVTHKNKNKKQKQKPKQEPNKKNNIYQYLILKGNASYLIRNCMKHRINWTEVENTPENANYFNFKWKELSSGIDYNSLNRNPGMKQIVNHYENHYVISNKANMFINIMKYCEQRKLSIFKYVPFTIVFKIKDRRKIKNTEKQKRWTEKLEKLKNFIQNINTNIKDYNDIGKFYYNEEYIKDKEKRNEFERVQQIKMYKRKRERELEESKLKELKDSDKLKEIFKKQKLLKETEKFEEEKYKGKFQVYSDIFPRLKITDKLPTRYKTSEDKERDKKNDGIIGNNTLIEIPKTHFQGKNMWVLKAVNLNRGMCIKVVNSFEQMEKVINRFKKGVDYRFTAEEIEEEQGIGDKSLTYGFGGFPLSDDEGKMQKTFMPMKIEVFDENGNKSANKNERNKTEENTITIKNRNNNIDKIDDININNLNKNKKEEDKEEKINNCNKILIQKYIENPLLYKGRKCDMRIWVLLTHQMKVFLFKEGHLKTCSVEFDLNSQDAFTHITNYSFQKKNTNFQKFEKGNEVPFYEFQKFIDENYPQKNYKLKRDLMKQIKEIISISMRSGKNKINKNGRSHQFEIYGYDFMLDADFNAFLIEINTNPGLEISSPWIQIVVPRMLDDALRLTVDKVFEPIYDFSKNHKEELNDEQKKIFEKNKNKIEVDFNAVDANIDSNNENEEKSNLNNILNISKDSSIITSAGNTNNNENKNNKNISFTEVPNKTLEIKKNISNNIFSINLDLDESDKKLIPNQENNEVINTENKNKPNKIININIVDNKEKISEKIYIQNQAQNMKRKLPDKDKEKEKEKINKTIPEKKYNGKYISPFPVPGYSNDENLWCFVCDLNSKDPYDIKMEKEKEKEKQNEKISFTGIRHLLKKKDKKNNDKKNGKKGGKKNKNKSDKNKKH